MSVGGKIVQVYHFINETGESRAWINTLDKNEYCAVFVDGSRNYRLDDVLWWQGSIAYWTRRVAKDEFDSIFTDEKVIRYGFSGVTHPLGEEYQVRYDSYPIVQQKKEKIRSLELEIEYLKKQLEGRK